MHPQVFNNALYSCFQGGIGPLNGLLFFIGLLASLAGATIAVNGFRGKLHLRGAFRDHTGLGGVLIQILGGMMIALSQI
jgi:hypothetical protein